MSLQPPHSARSGVTFLCMLLAAIWQPTVGLQAVEFDGKTTPERLLGFYLMGIVPRIPALVMLVGDRTLVVESLFRDIP